MIQPLLSILIPTIVGREETFDRLCHAIHPGLKFTDENKFTGQFGIYFGAYEVCVIMDNKEMTIGEKRTKLYNMAKGVYSWQIDDDDDIANNAIEKIINAINFSLSLMIPIDCITFEEYVSIDGKEFKSNHSKDYGGWEGDGSKLLEDGFHYHRTPFFKSVIRTELANSVPIQPIRFGEDHAFANDLHPLIKSEVHISEQLYRYIHISSNHNERYGIKD